MTNIEKCIYKIDEISQKILAEKKEDSMRLDSYAPITHYTFGGYGNKVQDFLVQVQQYLENDDTECYIDLDKNLVKKKSLLRFLYKEKIEGNLLEKMFNFCLNPYNGSFMDHTIDLAYKLDPQFGKSIALLSLKNCHRISAQSMISSITLNNTLIKLSTIKFEPEDYPAIKIFLNHFSPIIKAQAQMYDEIITGFIKKSIALEGWSQFSSFLPINALSSEKDYSQTFEENEAPAYHLIINEKSIKTKFPKFIFTKDYKEMIQLVVDTISIKKEALSLQKAIITQSEKDKTYISFFSSTEKEINKKYIQDAIMSLMQIYHDNMDDYPALDQRLKFLEKNFNATFVSSQLEEKLDNKSESIKKKKI